MEERKFPCVIPPNPSEMTQEEKKLLIERLHEIELKAWDVEQAFSMYHLSTHVRVFPRGMIIAYLSEDDYANIRPAAWALTQIITYDLERPIETWYGATDDGYIVRTHNEEGDWLYGVNLSVPPGLSSSVTNLVLQGVKDLVVERKLNGLVFGARIPRYYKYHNIDVYEYVNQRIKKRPRDPELARYESYGFEIARDQYGIPKVLKNYFGDPESLDYGVLMLWRPRNEVI